MGPREDFLALFSRYSVALQTGLPEKRVLQVKERLVKEHQEMLRLLESEETLSRELHSR